MMIPSNYEINVAKLQKKPMEPVAHYYHYCRIELGDISKLDATDKLHQLRKFFPEEFKLTLSCVECKGMEIEEL